MLKWLRHLPTKAPIRRFREKDTPEWKASCVLIWVAKIETSSHFATGVWQFQILN